MSTSLGKKIREVRECEELTRDEFASLTGVAAATLKQYESGRRGISSEMLLKITQHPRFQKYALWLMTDTTSEAAGQISPALSPDGPGDILSNQKGQKAG